MNVLVACEESQEVCKAFRARGHRAFSCDIQECSGGHPEWHIDENGKILSWNDPRTAKIRSKTFPGIAKAMAEQWG